MKINFVAMSLVLIGCGDTAGNIAALVPSATPTTTPDATGAVKSEVIPAEVAIAPVQLYSLRVSGKGSLPDCFIENEAQLAYVSDEKQFYVCQAETWVAIDIRGQDGKEGQSIIGERGLQGVAGQDGLATGVVSIAEAAGANCPNGGYKTQAFRDSNKDGIKNDTEELLGTAAYICNGQNGLQGIAGIGVAGQAGSDGLSTGIRTITEAAGANCPTGGQKVQAFTDANRSGNYDSGDTLLGTASYICNGQVGATGATGATGKATKIRLTDIPVGDGTCPNGGVTSVYYFDNNDNDIYEPSLGDTYITLKNVCNGSNANVAIVSEKTCAASLSIPGNVGTYNGESYYSGQQSGSQVVTKVTQFSNGLVYSTVYVADTSQYDRGIVAATWGSLSSLGTIGFVGGSVYGVLISVSYASGVATMTLTPGNGGTMRAYTLVGAVVQIPSLSISASCTTVNY